MNDQLQTKLNTAIAEWMGWTYKIVPSDRDIADAKGYPVGGGPGGGMRYKWWTTPEGKNHPPPNHFSSLDACHDVIVRMDDAQLGKMTNWLCRNLNEHFLKADAPTMASAIAYALGLWNGKDE